MAAGIAAAAAVIAKYGYLPMLVPLSGLLVATHARRDRGRRLALFLLVAGAIIAAYVLVCFGSIVPASTGTYLGQTFRRTRGHIAVLQLTFGIVPFVLASAGAILAWRARRPMLVATWLVASAIYPAFHLWTANFVSGQKHAVAGFLFAYLFGGAALDHLWRTGWRARMVGVVTVLTVWGGAQWYWQEHSWSDTRSLTSYLVQHMSRGDRVVADSSWVYVLSLYPRGLIDAPSDVIDAHYSPELDGLDLCRIPWLVGSLDTAPGIRATVDRCGHRPAASAATTQYYLDTVRLRVGQHPSLVTLYRLAAGQEDATRSTESRP
jgi:hypothetical protein